MAISWDVKVSIVDFATERVIVAATRTDDTDPENILTESYSVDAIISTGPKKASVMQNIWNQHLVYQTHIALIGTLEADAKANLEGRET